MKQDYEKEQCRYYEEYRQRQMMQGGCGSVMMIALVVMIMAMLTSCKQTEYITVPEVHNEHHWHTDSVHQTDSIIRETTTTIMQLDSAAMAKYGITLKGAQQAWLVKSAELERQIQMLMQLSQQKDSVRDSIPVPVPVPVVKEVPAELTWWQQTRMHIGGIVFWLALILLFIKFGLPLLRKWIKF
jgi:hypothetical protein